MAEKHLTPSEMLALEVLIARYRLGERLWTFDRSASKAVTGLSRKGLAVFVDGTVQNTIRAYLTDAAVAEYLSQRYIPPVAYGSKKLSKKFKKIFKDAKKLKKKLALKDSSKQ